VELTMRGLPPVYGYGASDSAQQAMCRDSEHNVAAKWAVDAAVRDACSQIRIVLIHKREARSGEASRLRSVHAVVVQDARTPYCGNSTRTGQDVEEGPPLPIGQVAFEEEEEKEEKEEGEEEEEEKEEEEVFEEAAAGERQEKGRETPGPDSLLKVEC